MIPAMLSAIGLSLSEFADSMIVSYLLGAKAFVVVNLASPTVLAVSMVYTITGLGGSLLFAEYLGKKDRKNADKFFSISTALALLSGTILFILLMSFRPLLSSFFACPAEFSSEFDKYVNVLIFFVPIGILQMHFTYFLPVIGAPALSMGLVLTENVLNIILDYVFIGVFGMGCDGAAAATLISYIITFVIMILIWYFGRIPLTLRRFKITWQDVKKIVMKGFPAGSVQAGYVVTTIFCNHFMNMAFGINGVVAMSLFSQLDSVISVVLTGIVDNNASFAAMLKGEGDYYGIRSLSKRVTVMIVFVCSVLSVVFAAFPEYIASIFSIHDTTALDLIEELIRIYVLYYPLRCIILVLRDIYTTLDRSMYATVLGVLDKVVSVPLIGGVLYTFAGGYGVIAAFPVSMLLIFILIAVINCRIVKKSKGRYSPILLLDENYPLKAIYSYSSITLEDAYEIGSYITDNLEDIVKDCGVLKKISLAAEEIGIYIISQCDKDTPVDYLVSFNGSDYLLTCRSPGKPFYPIKEYEAELSPNEMLLTGMFHIRHEYTFGLNSTTLTIGAKGTVPLAK